MYFGDWLSRWRQYSPDKIAVIDYRNDGEGSSPVPVDQYSYVELDQRANRVAHFLQQNGIKSGDRVAFLNHNCIEAIDLFFATAKLGTILVPLNFRLQRPGLEYVLRDTAAKMIIAGSKFKETAQSLANSLPDLQFYLLEDDFSIALENGDATPPVPTPVCQETPHLIIYTSGTTGSPKGAIITHGQVHWNSINTAIACNLTSADRSIINAPLYHTGGWNVLTTPLFHFGGTLVLQRCWDADGLLEIIGEQQITIFFGLPTMFKMLVASPKFEQTDFSRVRVVLSGGEACPHHVLQTFSRAGMPIRQGYGLTEVGPNVFSLPAQDAERKAGSVGFPNFHVDAKIVDEQGREVAPGKIGELIMAGPMLCGGYWNNPEATQKAITGGWFHTGDLFRKDNEGYHFVVGRKKDMYISGGENVYPAEIEKYLQRHPDILEVAVVGIADEKWGEVGKAFIVFKKGRELTPEEVKSWLRDFCAKYQIPKYFIFLDELPKGDTGKIQKKQLAEGFYG